MGAKIRLAPFTSSLMIFCSAAYVVGGGIGPDIVLTELRNVNDYNRTSEVAALQFATTACNAGDEFARWQHLPSNQHPVIAMNLYRLKDERLEQLGQSWVKHGFATIMNAPNCGVCDGNFGQVLGVGCADTYGASINRGPNLGPRGEINPVTGFFDGATANDHSGHTDTAISHSLQVFHTDLANPGARYFVEGLYVHPGDATAGRGNNNASYREVSVTGFIADWTFANVGSTVQETPAIFAWAGASFSILDSWPVDGRIIVANKAIDLGGGRYRYEYGIYNMNSERGVQAFSVPVGSASVVNIGFHHVPSQGEGFFNRAWPSEIAGGMLTWATGSFAANPNNNAIRWGTMYNFWFEADAPPVASAASLARFKPGLGGNLLFANIQAPAPSDCNGNGRPDEEEVAEDGSLDCNSDGFLDECQLDGNDCNANGLPDECDLPGNDCNGSGIPDACELANNDCDGNGRPDDCQNDCDGDGIIDACASAPDCNVNTIPDSCDVSGIEGGRFTFLSFPVNTFFGDDPTFVSNTIIVVRNGTLLDVDVGVDITHTYVADLVIRLEHNGTEVRLWAGRCGDRDDILATFDDDGRAPACASPISGTIAPTSAGGDPLALFNGLDAEGDWTLTVEDLFPSSDHGVFNTWSITVGIEAEPPFSTDFNGNGIPDECEGCGDLDADVDVDGDDFSVFLGAFGHSAGDPEFVSAADYDGDSLVSLVDYQFWLQCYRAFIGDTRAGPPAPGDLGDIDGDGSIDGGDIQGFVYAITDPGRVGIRERFVADMDGDGAVTVADVGLFVEQLLAAGR